MKNLVSSRLVIVILATMAMYSTPVFSGEENTAGDSESESLVLRSIMRDMGKEMQSIADAISREEWQRIEKDAMKIADHPQPPLTEKIRILAFVGTDVGEFKGLDGKTHAAARVLSETAATKDGKAVIAEFSNLQNTCLQCHQTFRKSFQAHFYGKD